MERLMKNPRKFRVDARLGGVEVVAFARDGHFVQELAIIGGNSRRVCSFETGEADRVDALINDLITAREHVFGAWPGRNSGASVNSSDVVDLRSLLSSLKEQTQSRAEFARCEAALKKLGGV
jgi:hypothetical protein